MSTFAFDPLQQVAKNTRVAANPKNHVFLPQQLALHCCLQWQRGWYYSSQHQRLRTTNDPSAAPWPSLQTALGSGRGTHAHDIYSFSSYFLFAFAASRFSTVLVAFSSVVTLCIFCLQLSLHWRKLYKECRGFVLDVSSREDL